MTEKQKRLGTVFEKTSTTEFVIMLDQEYDDERLLFSYIEFDLKGNKPNPNQERIIARITGIYKENPLLSRDQAIVNASINLSELGINFSRRFTHGWAKCTVIGVLTERGLDMNLSVPAPNTGVWTPSSQTLRKLFFNPAPSHVPLGKIETFGSEEVPVTLNADAMVTEHFSIFGMTGSGKTNTAAKLLEELMARGHRIVIFDSHDDYKNIENFNNLIPSEPDVQNENDQRWSQCKAGNRECDAVRYVVKKLNPSIPTDVDKKPLIPEKEENQWVCERLIRTASIVYGNQPSHQILQKKCEKVSSKLATKLSSTEPWTSFLSEERVVSRKAFPELKNYGKQFRDFSIKLLESFQGEQFTDPQRNWLWKYITASGEGLEYINNIKNHLETNPPSGKGTKEAIKRQLDIIESIYEDANSTDANPLDLETFFKWVADKKSAGKQSVYRISLTDLSNNLRKAMVYGIVTYFFRSFKFENYRIKPVDKTQKPAYSTLFVLEEARSLIPKTSGDDTDIAGKMARVAMGDIANEGRKFGLGYGIISQKPSSVDPVVVSQSNTFILHQLKSPDDQRYVRDVTEGISAEELEMVKSLGTGKAIASGVAIKSPVLLQVYPRYSQEGTEKPTPIANELSGIEQIRNDLGINLE